ncbi:MAG: riboflavin kinase/FMN adenylyltransferase [Rhodothermales bacterium]|jgi:riboflavin kinase/FMN adenylyltransferase
MHTVSAVSDLPSVGITRAALACGVFDGLHRGHQSIVDTVLAQAKATGAAPVIITFSPHPMSVVRPDRQPKLLFAEDHRLRLLRSSQAAATVVIPFTAEMAAVPPAEFIETHLLGGGVEITAVCVGEDWRFGHRAQGDTVLLAKLGDRLGFAVSAVSKLESGGAPISSTRIREAVNAGDLNTAEELLGRRFSIAGFVAQGKGMGADVMGCPTANIVLDDHICPPNGIYAAEALLYPLDEGEHTERLQGAVYIGHSPTVSDSQPLTLEIHCFDFNRNIYGRKLEVAFISRVREDRRFDSIAKLREQIARDLCDVRKIHETAALLL